MKPETACGVRCFVLDSLRGSLLRCVSRPEELGSQTFAGMTLRVIMRFHLEPSLGKAQDSCVRFISGVA